MRGTPSRRPPKRLDADTSRGVVHSPSTELSLSIGREGLGLELVKGVSLGPFRLTELSVDLPSLTFPLDVSGGVARFRHRRGVLRRIALESDSTAFAAWAAPRCAGILSSQSPEVSAAFHAGRVTLTLVAGSSEKQLPFPPPLPAALAFDVLVEPRDGDLVAYVANARGAGLTQPASLLAMRVAHALFSGANALPRGARFTFERIAAQIARFVLPDAGARAPDSDAIRFRAPFAADTVLVLEGAAGHHVRDSDVVDARIKEALELAAKADDAMLAGDSALARNFHLEALERAPKHPLISLRIAEIDAAHGKRNVSALGLLRDVAEAHSPMRVGSLQGDLLLSQGDREGAMAAYAKEADSEESGPLAALIHAKAAALQPDALDALVWLDFAVSRAPARATLRWLRVEKRLAAGKVEAALSDVEHLDAIAHGPREKFRVWLNAGRAWEAAGNVDEAGEMYENALRYSPDDPAALFGLGTSLVHRKRSARGIGLIVQALELAEARRQSADTVSPMVLALARALADQAGDLPAAIARVRTVPRESSGSVIARGLEGRWRKTIGDFPGASLAFARMRDGIDQHADANVSGEVIELLLEAAAFERDVKHDIASSRRHLTTALSRRAGDQAILGLLRDAGPVPAAPPAPSEAGDSRGDPEARAEELIVQLKARPEDDTIVDELADLLSTLGRGLELLALLSARLEDASAERRLVLIPKQRAVLLKLAAEARSLGHEQEAELYDMAREAL